METIDTSLIPEHLKEGWEAYREWWEARYRAADPLPPGGTFVLNRRAVLIDEIFRFHLEAADGLGLPFEAVKIDLQTDQAGRILPMAEIHPPDDWSPAAVEGQPDSVVQEYVTGYLKVLYDQLQSRLSRRVASLGAIRRELLPIPRVADR